MLSRLGRSGRRMRACQPLMEPVKRPMRLAVEQQREERRAEEEGAVKAPSVGLWLEEEAQAPKVWDG